MDTHIKLKVPSRPDLFLTFSASRQFIGAEWAKASTTPQSEREAIERRCIDSLTDDSGLLCLSRCIAICKEHLAAHNAAISTVSAIQEPLFKTLTPATPELIEAERLEGLACSASCAALAWVRDYPATTGHDLSRIILTLIDCPSRMSSLTGAECIALHKAAERILEAA